MASSSQHQDQQWMGKVFSVNNRRSRISAQKCLSGTAPARFALKRVFDTRCTSHGFGEYGEC